MNVCVRELFLLSTCCWILLASGMGDMSGALTGIILAKIISSSINNRNNQQPPSKCVLVFDSDNNMEVSPRSRTACPNSTAYLYSKSPSAVPDSSTCSRACPC